MQLFRHLTTLGLLAASSVYSISSTTEAGVGPVVPGYGGPGYGPGYGGPIYGPGYAGPGYGPGYGPGVGFYGPSYAASQAAANSQSGYMNEFNSANKFDQSAAQLKSQDQAHVAQSDKNIIFKEVIEFSDRARHHHVHAKNSLNKASAHVGAASALSKKSAAQASTSKLLAAEQARGVGGIYRRQLSVPVVKGPVVPVGVGAAAASVPVGVGATAASLGPVGVGAVGVGSPWGLGFAYGGSYGAYAPLAAGAWGYGAIGAGYDSYQSSYAPIGGLGYGYGGKGYGKGAGAGYGAYNSYGGGYAAPLGYY
jgi:hypothetical protein